LDQQPYPKLNCPHSHLAGLTTRRYHRASSLHAIIHCG